MVPQTRDAHPQDGPDSRSGERGELTCRELVAFLDAYLAGELIPERHRLFERHLDLCPDCRAYLDAYRKTIELGRRALGMEGERTAAPEVPDDLVRDILALLEDG